VGIELGDQPTYTMDTYVKCTKDQRESRRSRGNTGPPLDGYDRRVFQHRLDCLEKGLPYIRHADKVSGGLYAARDIVGAQTIMISFGDIVTSRKKSLENPMGRAKRGDTHRGPEPGIRRQSQHRNGPRGENGHNGTLLLLGREVPIAQ
jgi:hypothetical protein